MVIKETHYLQGVFYESTSEATGHIKCMICNKNIQHHDHMVEAKVNDKWRQTCPNCAEDFKVFWLLSS